MSAPSSSSSRLRAAPAAAVGGGSELPRFTRRSWEQWNHINGLRPSPNHMLPRPPPPNTPCLMRRQKVAEVAKDEPLFKRSQTLSWQTSGRFTTTAASGNLPPGGMEGSNAPVPVMAEEEPDPTIRAKLKGALADANGVRSIKVDI